MSSSVNKRKRADGTFYYYYYKKKRGKKKKRGPKKKIGKIVIDRSWNYKILKFAQRKQIGYIGTYRTYTEAKKKLTELVSESEKVEFPVRFINNSDSCKVINDYVCEFAIMKKIKNDGESNHSMVRNKYGRYVEHITTSDKYYLYEKEPAKIEETFWVYGKNPRRDRKTYSWIYTYFVDQKLYNGYDGIINIYVYGNKVIFKYDFTDFEFVICKNPSDAIRMYNLLLSRYEKEKNVIFTGSVNGRDDRGKSTIEMLMDRTGWTANKISKRTTTK